MSELINITGTTGARALNRTAHTERAADLLSEHGAYAEYYRAYYRTLVEMHANRSSEGRRGLEAIRMERRRKARRGKWLYSIKSLAGMLRDAEVTN